MRIEFSPEQLSEMLTFALDVEGRHVQGSPSLDDAMKMAGEMLVYLDLSESYYPASDEDEEVYFIRKTEVK